MRKTIFFNCFLFLFFLMALSGCKKVLDYVKGHPNGVADRCRVEQLILLPNDYFGQDTVKFIYDDLGNPTNIVYPRWYGGNVAFRYDKAHRLRSYQRSTNSVGADLWHKYNYVNSTRIIDTIFKNAHGDLTAERPDSYAGIEVRKCELDAYGRIIRVSLADGTVLYTFEYDNRGNRIIPGTGMTSAAYTDKINIHQTNKVWMLIDYNYSVNQLGWEVAKFNKNDLPEVFNDNIALFDAIYRKCVVSYSCK